MNKNIYESNANPSFISEDGYSPLYKTYERQFTTRLINNLKGDHVHVWEANLGLDMVEFDDSLFQIGIQEQEKQFINFQ